MLLTLVAVYLVVSIVIGLVAARQVHSASDYVTAGRHLPMAVVLAMVFATWFGAETVLGISATFLEEGFRGLISDPLGASLCLVLFGLIFALPLYRMKLMTLGDFFRIRYDRRIELVISICIVISYLGWVAALATMALGSIPQQDVFQRVNSSKNETVAVWATTLGGLSYFFFAAVPLFLAYTATIIDPAMTAQLMKEDSQLVLPNLVAKHMPFWIQVVFFGALLSVIMSTASGTLLAPSVTFAENVVRGSVRNMSDRQLLLTTRITVVVFTCMVTTYAMITDASIHTMVEHAYRITLAGAFVPLAAGLFWRRASNLGASLSIFFGLGIWLMLEFSGAELAVEPQLIGLAFGLLGMIVGSFISPNPHRRHRHGMAPHDAGARHA
jgi:Na+/proline symporter